MSTVKAGYWIFVKEPNEIEKFIMEDGKTVCEVYEPFSPEKVWLNANLIAAAPELLEALEGMLENEHQRKFESWFSSKSPSGDCDSVQSQWVESSDYLDFLDSYEDEIKVIAKAKGESQ